MRASQEYIKLRAPKSLEDPSDEHDEALCRLRQEITNLLLSESRDFIDFCCAVDRNNLLNAAATVAMSMKIVMERDGLPPRRIRTTT
jgi:hypothetical protein